jgi:membrane protein
LPAARTVGRVHQDDERESGISGKAVTAVATDGPRAAVHRFRTRLAALRERHEWLAHLTRAGARYIEQRGNHFAAAITFFSILTAVPLLMVAFAAAGYVLWFNPELLTNLENSIAASVPAGLFDAVNPIIETAIGQRNTVAGVGLVAALWSGIWWMSNLREAVSAQWGLPPPHPAALQRLAYDLVALVGLGGALVASLLVTLVGTGVGETVLRFVGFADDGWTPTLLRGVSIAVGLLANWLTFLWAITRLPRTDVPMRGAARAALLGAVGFEVLKQGAATYLESVTTSASGAVFGSLLGLLLFTYIVARLVLGVTAWAATARGNERPYPIPPPVPAVIRPQVVVRPEQLAATVGALGAAALVGVFLGAWLGGWTPGGRRSGDGRQPGGRGRNGS